MRAALLAAAGLAAVANAQDGFRTCRRIEFNEGDLDANGVFAPDAFLEEFGVRIVVRDSPGSTSQGRPAGDDYTAIPQRDGAIFDTTRPTGTDVDLGSPNWQCDATCPAGFETCAICAGPGPLADPRVAERFLPTGHPGCGDEANPDFVTCPGVGCGGGFWLRSPSETSPFINYVYPDRLADGTIVNRNTNREACDLVLDDTGCPQVNPTMNCRTDGSVIIVQENPGGVPDDRAQGGTISFIFDQPIELLGLSVLDMDDVEGTSTFPGFVYGMESADESVNTDADFERVAPLFGGGDNSLDDVEVYYPDINRVVVWFRGSGSVNDLEFCAGAAPEVNLTTASECKYTWEVTKTVNQDAWALFAGQSTDEVFTTVATRSEECESGPVTSTGSLTVGSPSGRVHRIVDVIGGFDNVRATDPSVVSDKIDSFACEPFTPTPDRPHVLVPEDGASVTIGSDEFLPGNTLTCSFSAELTSSAFTDEGESFLKVEFVAATELPDFAGPSLIAIGSVTQPEEPVLIDASAQVTDPDAGLDQTVSETTSFNSTRTQSCAKGDEEGNAYNFSCTSTVTPSDSGSDAAVSATAGNTLSCYDMDVIKTAAGTADRVYSWTIDKTAMPDSGSRTTALALDAGDGDQTVQYKLTVSNTNVITNVVVSGDVTVNNHHPSADATVDIADATFPGAVFSGSGCSADGSAVVVAAGGSTTCSYTVALGAIPKEDTNTVSATQQHGVSYSASATFSVAVTDVNANVVVTDKFADEASAVDLCSASAADGDMSSCFRTRAYSAGDCGSEDDTVDFSVVNTGTVASADDGTVFGTSTWTTTVTTTCERCGECPEEQPMYPMALTDGVYRITSSGMEKSVTLCWD